MPTWPLSRATGRKVTWRLTAPSDASFNVDGTARDATQIRELVTDL